MTKHGYIKAGIATPKISIGNPLLNVSVILNILDASNAGVLLFPELCLTGYSSGDLFFQKEYLDNTLKALESIINSTKFKGVYVLGLPLKVQDVLYNCAVVIQNKEIKGVIPKYYLPNSNEFYEKRWFQSGLHTKIDSVVLLNQKVNFGQMIFTDQINEISFGVEICQDMWAIQSPGDTLSLAGAHMILNLSASTEVVGKPVYRKTAVLDASRKQLGAYLYTSSGFTESTTDVVFSNHKIATSLGRLVKEEDFLTDNEIMNVDIDIEAIRYQRRIDSTFKDEQLFRNQSIKVVNVNFNNNDNFEFENKLNKLPFIPLENTEYEHKIANEIQVRSLMQKFTLMPKAKIIIGISGGLDSALALLVAHQALKRLNRSPKDIIAVTMPTKVTSKATKSDAIKLMEALNVTVLEINLESQINEHLKGINHNNSEDVTYENVQARFRTLNLMNLSNQYGGFVLGTGDMSEIALGWMTFNGDHMSMYDVNAGLTKTWVQSLIKHHLENDYKFIKDVLTSILERPISPELKENQDTEQVIGKYEINDFILYHFLASGAETTKIEWLIQKTFDLSIEESKTYTTRFFDRFYGTQFKRQPMPEGPKVLKVSLSPRGELRLPSEIKRK